MASETNNTTTNDTNDTVHAMPPPTRLLQQAGVGKALPVPHITSLEQYKTMHAESIQNPGRFWSMVNTPPGVLSSQHVPEQNLTLYNT